MSRPRCPDCGGRMLDAMTEQAFCAYKRGPGYGPCGEPRPLPSLLDAATAVAKAAYGLRDEQGVAIPSRTPTGSRRREWDDFRFAIERAGRAVQDDGPADCRDSHDFRLTTDFDGEPVRCGRCKCLPGAVQDDGLRQIVAELADLSVADSPEFRDPGWEDALRALIRRARRAAPPLNASEKETS